MSEPRASLQSSATTLAVLNLLLRHFAHGLANKDIAQALNIQPSAVTRHVQALEEAGFAERIPETGRIRPSVRMAQVALQITQSLDAAGDRIQELKSRILLAGR